MADFIDEKDSVKIMQGIGVQEEGITLMKDKSFFRLVLVKDVRNAPANIIKQDMLSIGGDVAVNKGCINCTVDKSDILIMGTMHQIKLLVKKLKTQVSEIPSIAQDIEMLIKQT